MKKHFTLALFIFFFFLISKEAFSAQSPKTGFLVLAPDRGFVGNNETQLLFDQFNEKYISSLAIVGRKYNGMESNYSTYIQKS